jgi:hypothetical protein
MSCYFRTAGQTHDNKISWIGKVSTIFYLTLAAHLLHKVFPNDNHCSTMGRGTILIIPVRRSKVAAPYFMLPKVEDNFFIGILRRYLEPCSFDSLVRINEETYAYVE